MNKEQVIEWIKQTVAVDQELKANNTGLLCTQWELKALSVEVMGEVLDSCKNSELGVLCLDFYDGYSNALWGISIVVDFDLTIQLRSVPCKRIESTKYKSYETSI